MAQEPNLSKEYSCQTVVDLLPWFSNGSLDTFERTAITSHLQSCEGCRAELHDCRNAFELLDQHLPSDVLAEFALGLEPISFDRERIERHLAICDSCTHEMETIQSAEGLADDDPSEWMSPPAGIWRAWPAAIAASLTAILVAGALVLYGGGSSSDTERRLASESKPAVTLQLFADGFESGSTAGWTAHSQNRSNVSKPTI